MAMRRAWRWAAVLALAGLALARPAWAQEAPQPQLEEGQEVQAQRADWTWQQAIVDKVEATGYRVQFMEEPYGPELLPPGRVRFDPAKGTLAQQLAPRLPGDPEVDGPAGGRRQGRTSALGAPHRTARLDPEDLLE
jgi:hypothetical protein